jgi:hypothetical protein
VSEVPIRGVALNGSGIRHSNIEERKTMIVIADRLRNLVTIHGDRGTEITLTWSAALVLATLLREASVTAEPAPAPGKCYSPTSGRWG